GCTQEISGMQRRDRACGVVADRDVVPFAAQAHDALGHIQDMLRGGAAEKNHDLGLDQLDLTFEERPADLSLLRRWRSVTRRAPVDDIGDMNLLFVESDRGENLVE